MVSIKIGSADNISTVNTLKRIARKSAKIILTKHRFQHKFYKKKLCKRMLKRMLMLEPMLQ